MDFAFLPFTDHFLHPLIHRHSSLVKSVQGAYRKGTDRHSFQNCGYVKQLPGQTAATGPLSER